MKDQIIITMGREHGSGGHYIADMIARALGIKLYDKDSIESEIVSEGYSEELIRRMDEKPVNFFASRRIGRFSNSLEVNVAEKTFDMIRAKAASGESFGVSRRAHGALESCYGRRPVGLRVGSQGDARPVCPLLHVVDVAQHNCPVHKEGRRINRTVQVLHGHCSSVLPASDLS